MILGLTNSRILVVDGTEFEEVTLVRQSDGEFQVRFLCALVRQLLAVHSVAHIGVGLGKS